MATRKLTTSSVEVFRVKGDTMDIAFKAFTTSKGLDNHSLEKENAPELSIENIRNGEIYKNSKKLYPLYMNNQLSEFTIRGALYNAKPIIKDSSRVLTHNIVVAGTKKWETTNTYRSDSGEILDEDVSTKAESLARAKELAMEHCKSVNVVASKRLVGMDGILATAEYVPTDHSDDSNVYVFWMFVTKVIDVEEDDLIEDNTEEGSNGQICIKEDLRSYVGRSIVSD